MKMSRSSRKIVASKASIHADGFTKESKIRQTTAHHAFHTTAKGDVKICIEQQYPKVRHGTSARRLHNKRGFGRDLFKNDARPLLI